MSRQTGDEHRLVDRLVAGERDAFEWLYRRHNASMVRVCAGLVRNHATAEELAQETWISVLKNIDGFEGRSSLAGWIYTILLNKARSRLRRDGRSISFDEGGEDNSLQAAFDGRGRWKDMPELWDELTPERVVAGRSVLDHVNAAIETLPSAQRAVLILRGQNDIDSAEVCAILGISEGNMRVLLHRARLAVRAALDRLQ